MKRRTKEEGLRQARERTREALASAHTLAGVLDRVGVVLGRREPDLQRGLLAPLAAQLDGARRKCEEAVRDARETIDFVLDASVDEPAPPS